LKRALVVCAALTFPRAVVAQQEPLEAVASPMPAQVELAAPACAEAVTTDVLLRMLRVELAGDGVERVELATPGDTAGGALARVSIELPRCAADASEFLVTVDDATTRKSVRRAVDLADIPAATRPRALALAVAELLRASWLELALPTAPPTPSPVPEPVRDTVRLRMVAAVPRARPPREVARWAPFVGVGFEGRTYALASTQVAGLRLTGGVVAPWNADGTRLRLRLDGGVSFGSGASLLGDADVLVATGAVAVTFARGTSVQMELGPRVELGVARAAGRATTGRSAAGVTASEDEALMAGVGLIAGLRGRLSASWSASLELEGQWVFGGVDARSFDGVTGLDVRVVGVFGPSLALRAGIVWDP
jgi:hypothetical protein